MSPTTSAAAQTVFIYLTVCVVTPVTPRELLEAIFALKSGDRVRS
jgi:hypothetical protein